MAAADLDMNKVSYEIFSILESKFLFGYDDPKRFLQATPGASPLSPAAAAPGLSAKVRILSVDAGGATDGLLAAASLVRLESSLRRLTGDCSARICDFFDVAAGSGLGGILVALLFTGGPGGRPPFSAADAFDFLVRNRRALQPARTKKGAGLAGMFRKKSHAGGRRDQVLRQAFGSATLRDAVKPVLIPCYDLATGATFVFSRAGAAEADGYDFPIREVCAATAGGAEIRSVDGRTVVAAVDGGAAAGNPAAAAITHVLNNRAEFPFVAGVEDLLVVSLGNGEPGAPASVAPGGGGARWGKPDAARIASEGAADMVDQAVAMSFGDHRSTNYVRVQANLCDSGKFQSSSDTGELLAMAEGLLAQKNVESVLFWGKRVSQRTNAERLESASAALVRVQDGGRTKEGSPRSSSSSLLCSTSGSPMAAASPR
ncbi:hypothetical protein Taro_043439 [Colocasia esculenta]|uniref:Patatin n=1 Tax=Colocasia esculenta TaxID=4460 RepID=A0A843WYX4_COLES|nr:hypothetical protein [Colocasia esculenta]